MGENENNGVFAPVPLPNYATESGPRQINYLKTNRSLLKFILLSLISFGFCGIGIIANIGSEVNIIAGRHDGRNTLNYWILKLIQLGSSFFEGIIEAIILFVTAKNVIDSTSEAVANFTPELTITPAGNSISGLDSWLSGIFGSVFFAASSYLTLAIMSAIVALTLFALKFIWFHIICTRLGNELRIRNIQYIFSAKDFWIWDVLWPISICIGSSIIGTFVNVILGFIIALAVIIGPLIFYYKFIKASNYMNEHFNYNC